MSKTTELVFILDKSGSMHGLENDTLGGYNSLLVENQKNPTPCLVSTILFNDRINLLHDRIDISTLNELTVKDYFVGGSTALLDAIGYGITKIENVLKHQDHQVLFVIITDGYENASREYNGQQIKNMIEKAKSSGWDFVFLGADIDIEVVSKEYGFDADKATSYHRDSKGVATNFETLSHVVSNYRNNRTFEENAFDSIKKDYHSRKKRSA